MERKCLHSTYICLLLILLLNKTSAIAVASYNNDADDSTAYLASNHFDRLVYSYYNNNNNNNNNNDSSMLYNFNNHSAAAAAGSKTLDSAGLLTTGANHHHDYHEAAVTTDAYLDSHSSMFCSGSILQCLFLSLVLGLMIISTIIGNSFVIAAVVLERNLQGVANYLIVSLAVADLTVAIMVMPIGAYQEVYHTWNLGGVLCDIWTSFDVLCCTASILHLVAIALDRYWAITNVHYGAKRTAKRIVTMIVFIWTLSALMAISPHLFGLSYEASSSERCQLTNNLTFQLVSTLGAFYLPLVVMCIIYWKIFQSAKFRIRSKGAGMTSVQRRKEEEKARRRSPKSILPSDEQNNKVEAGEAGEEKDDGHNVATRFLIRTSRSLSFSARKSPANSSSQKPPSITNITGNNRHNSKNSLATGGNTTTNNETSFTRNNLRQQSLRVVRADRTDDIAKPAAKPALELPPQVPTTNQTPTTLLLPTSNHTTATTDTNSTSTTKESAAQKQSESSVSPNLSTSPNQGHKSIKSIIKKNMFVFSHIALLQKARQAAERPFDDELYDNQSDEEYEEEVKEANKSSSSQKKISPPKQSVDEHHHNHNHQHKSHHEKKSTAAINRQNSSYDNNTSSYHQTTDNNTKPNNNQIKKYLEDRRVNKSGNNNTQPVARKSNTFVFGLKEEDERTKAAARKLSSVLTDRIGAGHDYCHRESQVSQKSGGWLQPDKSLAMYEDSTLFNVASSTRASYAYSENDTEEGSMFDLNRQRHASSSSSTRLNLNPPPIESSSAPVATAVTGASFAAVVAAAAHANRVKKISFNENEKS